MTIAAECEHGRALLVADVRAAVGPWCVYCPECGASGASSTSAELARQAWRAMLEHEAVA